MALFFFLVHFLGKKLSGWGHETLLSNIGQQYSSGRSFCQFVQIVHLYKSTSLVRITILVWMKSLEKSLKNFISPLAKNSRNLYWSKSHPAKLVFSCPVFTFYKLFLSPSLSISKYGSIIAFILFFANEDVQIQVWLFLTHQVITGMNSLKIAPRC